MKPHASLKISIVYFWPQRLGLGSYCPVGCNWLCFWLFLLTCKIPFCYLLLESMSPLSSFPEQLTCWTSSLMCVFCWPKAHVFNFLKIICWQVSNSFIGQGEHKCFSVYNTFKGKGFSNFLSQTWRMVQIYGTSVPRSSFIHIPSDVRLEVQAYAFPTRVPFIDQFHQSPIHRAIPALSGNSRIHGTSIFLMLFVPWFTMTGH